MPKKSIIEHPIMNFFGVVGDIIILNLIFVLCSLPIITMGTAITALYSTTMKMQRKEGPAVFKRFFRAFRSNLKASMIVWVIIMVVSGLLLLNIRMVGAVEGSMQAVLKIILGIICGIYLMLVVYIFPYIARFQNSIKDYFKNAFTISVANLPITLLMIGIDVGVALIVLYTSRNIVIGTIFGFFFGFALLAYIKSALLVRVLRKYEDK